MSETAATTEPTGDRAATLILQCQRCHSHFEQDFEEVLCWQCVQWAELLEQRDSYAHVVRGARGGRR
jgi:uncharacterized metal-binding protein YceD (DUF177 family)